MKTHKHLAVVGRANGEDEAEVFLYEQMTVDQAETAFKEDQRELLQRCRNGLGQEIYIDWVLTSVSPIEIAERNV